MILVHDLVVKWGKEHGYDGLFNDECACLWDDLAPCCDGIGEGCEFGIKKDCTEACGEWHEWEPGGWHVERKPEEAEHE